MTSLSLFTFMHWRRKWQPLQYSCLENPREGGAWWFAVYGVTQSWTRLKLLAAAAAHASKVMLKIFQARLQQYMNQNFQMFNLDLEKAKEPEIKLLTSAGSSKKQENSRRTSTSASLITLKPLTVDHNKLENSERDGTIRSPYLPPEKSVCRSRSNSYNQTWNKGLVQNWERSTSRLHIATLLI